MTRLLTTVAALSITVAVALAGYAAGGWTADTLIVTETETATAPPVTVEITRTERAARSQVSRPPVSDNSGPSEYHELTEWQRDYWRKAQTWAATERVRAIIACESGDRPGAVSPTGKYRGLFQFDADAWASYGGRAIASRPDQASREAQNYVAFRMFSGRGYGPWECA